MLRLMVTASGTGPIAASTATYMAKRHHGRAGNHTARSYRDVAKRLPDPAAPLPHLFDREPAVRMEKLRKLGAKKPLDFRDRHHSRHAPPSRRNRTRPLGLKEKLGRRRT
jgi:hypothetical protein